MSLKQRCVFKTEIADVTVEILFIGCWNIAATAEIIIRYLNQMYVAV